MSRSQNAIMVVDAVGYSRLMGADETGTLMRLKSVRKELIEPKIKSAKGRVIRLLGDGMLVEFEHVSDAFQCAVDIQQNMHLQANDSTNPDIRFRIGITLGTALLDHGDVFSNEVKVAVRLESLANAGEICISDEVRQMLDEDYAASCQILGKQTIGDSEQVLEVYRIDPQALAIEPSISEQPSKSSQGNNTAKTMLWISVGLLIIIVSMAVYFAL